MIEGKTKSGYKYKIDEKKLNDWEIFESIADMSSGDEKRIVLGTVKFVNDIIGDEKPKFMEFIRKKNGGYCPAEKVQELISEIMESAKDIKNS